LLHVPALVQAWDFQGWFLVVLEGVPNMAKLNTCPMHRIPNTLLRIPSERLDLPQDDCRSPALAVLRTPSYLRMSSTTSPSLRRSLSMVDLSTTPIPDMPSLVENTAELGVGILKDFRDFQDLNSSCSWCGELLEGLEKEGREGGGREEQGWSEEEEDSYEERTRDKERGSD